MSDFKIAIAKHKNMRISAQKARLVADQIRNLPTQKAMNLLTFSKKKASVLLKEVLKSSIANAEHNNNMDIDSLYIQSIQVDEGLTMKRVLPRAKHRADRISKRMSHVTIKLAEKLR